MNKEQIELFGKGHDEGYWQGFGEAMKIALEVIATAHPKYLLDPHKVVLSSTISMRGKSVLQKKKMLPYSYDVITGKAEDKKAPWEQ